MRGTLFVFVTLFSFATATVAYEVAGMRDAMYSVFASMRSLLELSVDKESLTSESNRRKVFDAATNLQEQANLISAHVPRDEISFLASSLERYALWINNSYQWGLYDDTRNLIHDTVDVCIACHTRLASRRDSPLAEDFLNNKKMMQLPLRQRARLQTATRRFDDALASYTTLMEQSAQSDDFDALSREYLVLALRVKNDPRRAQDLLERLRKEPGIEASRRARIDAWVKSLRALSGTVINRADVKAAQRLVDAAEAALDDPATDSLINYIIASRLLYAWLFDERADSIEEGAQAYWLLGLTQYRINSRAWLPQAELYLEKAIRTAPSSEYARKAFTLLEKKMQESYPSAAGGLPRDVRKHLEMLKDMVGADRA